MIEKFDSFMLGLGVACVFFLILMLIIPLPTFEGNAEFFCESLDLELDFYETGTNGFSEVRCKDPVIEKEDYPDVIFRSDK